MNIETITVAGTAIKIPDTPRLFPAELAATLYILGTTQPVGPSTELQRAAYWLQYLRDGKFHFETALGMMLDLKECDYAEVKFISDKVDRFIKTTLINSSRKN
jgi:hypothetical protein